MSKKLIYILWFIGLFIFIFVAYSAVTFERKPLTNTSINNAIGEPAENPYVITDVVNSNIKIPIIDPSACKDNQEGYIYFQMGDEVFRYAKDSPIHISRIDSSAEERKARASLPEGIPEGCEGNPYFGASIAYSYSPMDAEYKKINILKIFLLSVKDGEEISHSQKYYQSSFQDFFNKNSRCFHIIEDLEKCVWPNVKSFRKEIYKSKLYKIMENPYVLECRNFVGDVECSTSYRIYQSLDFNYSFYLSENESWEEKNILKFDQYLRGLLENMRVTEKVNKGEFL